MLRAEQLALIQEANQQLLAIRQQEMEYYTNTFASFGTQGSLLAGFALGALTGLDMRDFDEGLGLPFWKVFFQILATVAVGASVHCILTTTFANIYGPNLALRGPSGSMVRAVKGMIAEKSGIFSSFIVCLIAFQFITLAATWIKMQTYAACTASVVLSVGATYWYKYCLRIYNRFKFIEPDIEWRNTEGGESADVLSTADAQSHSPPSPPVQTFQIDSSNVINNSGKATMMDQQAVTESPSSKHGWFSSRKDKDKDDVQSTSETGKTSSPTPERLFKEGYLSKMGKASMLSKGEWNRRYFVLQGSNMLYYRSREDYARDPTSSLKNRPIGLSGYTVEQLARRDRPPFEFILKPLVEDDDRRTWHFRCDLLEEMETWTKIFSAAVKM